MDFKYRYVGFGTNFTTASGTRSAGDVEPSVLFDNELAVDVGGTYWGLEGEPRAVIDHHFYRRDGQFPSAAAAVLHCAGRIRERFSSRRDVIWFVTHRDPDFDAYCALYLARGILEQRIAGDDWQGLGLDPTGWYQRPDEIDWFNPDVGRLTAERRVPILLAAYASHVDQCRRLRCPPNRGLHSILQAAILRGRNFGEDGGQPFFQEVVRLLSQEDRRFNPLFDSVVEHSDAFAPELALLDRELAAYHRDIDRARRAIVYLQESTVPFCEWFPHVAAQPLLDADGRSQAIHLQPAHQTLRPVDGIFIRAPECLLFKEWARLDHDHSSLGRGFRFTAVAYSGNLRGAIRNTSAYFFSLDPERAGNCHLYNVWARLQAAEVKACSATAAESGGAAAGGETPPSEAAATDQTHTAVCRTGFEGRAGAHVAAFRDPWFDGANYGATIVVQPNAGTLIAEPGVRTDLTDDPIARLVREQLEFAVYRTPVTIFDLAAAPGTYQNAPELVTERPLAETVEQMTPLRPGYMRFCRIALEPGLDIASRTIGQQIGRDLWRLLDPEHPQGVPLDFVEHHLLLEPHSVLVWNRCGLAVAYHQGADRMPTFLERGLRRIAEMSREFKTLAEAKLDDANYGGLLTRCEDLLRDLVRLQDELAAPDGLVLRRFLEASRLEHYLSVLRDMNTAAHQRLEQQTANQNLRQAGQNLEQVTRVQRLVHLLEYVIVPTYFAELWHMFAPHAPPVEASPAQAAVHGTRLWNPEILLVALVGIVLVEAFNVWIEGHSPMWRVVQRLLGVRRSLDNDLGPAPLAPK